MLFFVVAVGTIESHCTARPNGTKRTKERNTGRLNKSGRASERLEQSEQPTENLEVEVASEGRMGERDENKDNECTCGNLKGESAFVWICCGESEWKSVLARCC